MIKKKILVIDDEPEVADFLKTRLEPKGYEVAASYCGEDGLKKIKAARPDAVLLDIIMPGMDGLEVLRAIRRNPDTASMPVIMLTAKKDTASILKSENLSATDYIIKPFNLGELEKLLEIHV